MALLLILVQYLIKSYVMIFVDNFCFIYFINRCKMIIFATLILQK